MTIVTMTRIMMAAIGSIAMYSTAETTGLLKGRRNKPREYFGCGLAKFADSKELLLRTAFHADIGPTTMLEWQCKNCEHNFEASMMILGRKAAPCSECGERAPPA